MLSTDRPPAIAIATTWAISTARSPTTWQPRILPLARSARAEDDLVRSEPQPAPSLNRVRVDKARGAGIVVNRNPHIFQLLAPGSMFAHVMDDLARAREQPGIIQDWLAHRDTIPAELFSILEATALRAQVPAPEWGRHSPPYPLPRRG